MVFRTGVIHAVLAAKKASLVRLKVYLDIYTSNTLALDETGFRAADGGGARQARKFEIERMQQLKQGEQRKQSKQECGGQYQLDVRCMARLDASGRRLLRLSDPNPAPPSSPSFVQSQAPQRQQLQEKQGRFLVSQMLEYGVCLVRHAVPEYLPACFPHTKVGDDASTGDGDVAHDEVASRSPQSKRRKQAKSWTKETPDPLRAEHDQEAKKKRGFGIDNNATHAAVTRKKPETFVVRLAHYLSCLMSLPAGFHLLNPSHARALHCAKARARLPSALAIDNSMLRRNEKNTRSQHVPVANGSTRYGALCPAALEAAGYVAPILADLYAVLFQAPPLLFGIDVSLQAPQS